MGTLHRISLIFIHSALIFDFVEGQQRPRPGNNAVIKGSDVGNNRRHESLYQPQVVSPRPLPINARYMWVSLWASWSPWSFCRNDVQIRVRACNTIRGFSCFGENRQQKSCDRKFLSFDPMQFAGRQVQRVQTISHDYRTEDPWMEDRELAIQQLYGDYENEQNRGESEKIEFADVDFVDVAELKTASIQQQLTQNHQQPSSIVSMQQKLHQNHQRPSRIASIQQQPSKMASMQQQLTQNQEPSRIVLTSPKEFHENRNRIVVPQSSQASRVIKSGHVEELPPKNSSQIRPQMMKDRRKNTTSPNKMITKSPFTVKADQFSGIIGRPSITRGHSWILPNFAQIQGIGTARRISRDSLRRFINRPKITRQQSGIVLKNQSLDPRITAQQPISQHLGIKSSKRQNTRRRLQKGWENGLETNTETFLAEFERLKNLTRLSLDAPIQRLAVLPGTTNTETIRPDKKSQTTVVPFHRRQSVEMKTTKSVLFPFENATFSSRKSATKVTKVRGDSRHFEIAEHFFYDDNFENRLVPINERRGNFEIDQREDERQHFSNCRSVSKFPYWKCTVEKNTTDDFIQKETAGNNQTNPSPKFHMVHIGGETFKIAIPSENNDQAEIIAERVEVANRPDDMLKIGGQEEVDAEMTKIGRHDEADSFPILSTLRMTTSRTNPLFFDSTNQSAIQKRSSEKVKSREMEEVINHRNSAYSTPFWMFGQTSISDRYSEPADWSVWSKWSLCKCGKQSRTRSCQYERSYSNRGCIGKSYEIRTCSGGKNPTLIKGKKPAFKSKIDKHSIRLQFGTDIWQRFYHR